MRQILSIVLFAGCLGLSVAQFYGYDMPEWSKTEGTCTVTRNVVIKSLKSGRFVNGKSEVEMKKGWKNALYRKWILEAGLGWFVIRNDLNGGGTQILDVEGGCENAKSGTKLILWNHETPQDNNKFVINSDGTIQSLCGKNLYLKAESGFFRGELVLAEIEDPFTSEEDIRFKIKRA